MKTQLIVAAGIAALTLAACNKPAENTDESMAAGDAATDASAMAPASEGAMAPSDGAMSGGAMNGGTGGSGGASGAMAPAPQAMSPMSVEQPGAMQAGGTTSGANIGEAAQAQRGPRPTIPADSTGTTVPTRQN